MEQILSNKLEIAIESDIAEVARMIDEVEVFGERRGLPPKTIFQLKLALDELITNIVSHGFVSHGFVDGRKGVVHLVLELKDDRIAAELLHNGIALNSLGVDVPELSDDIDEVRIGGPGLGFVRTYVDRLDYRRDSGLNRPRLEKDLKAAG
jgi:serine/threonine-protein kinase RsbW